MKKTCTKCRIEKDVSEFHKQKNGKYGVRGDCKDCVKKYYKENKEKISKQKKEYYEENREEKIKI